MSFRRSSLVLSLTLAAFVLNGFGCASYTTPGRAAALSAFGVDPAAVAQTDAPVALALDKRPLARFPTGIAVVRAQACGYRSTTAEGWGVGRYSIITQRDVEKPEHFARFAKLPMVSGIAPLNRMLLPHELNSDLELRKAAAALHADMLLIYTLDTTFNVEDKAAPLTVISLGLSPNQKAVVGCTASATLLDTRNGYLYGVAEATHRDAQLASAWTSESAVDDTRQRVEAMAFEKLVGELEQTWAGVVNQYAKPASATLSPGVQ